MTDDDGYIDGCQLSGIIDRCHHRLMKPMTFAMLTALAYMIPGCADQSTVAAYNLRAPGGDLVASISTVQYSGPGSAALITTVSLTAEHSGQRTDVLTVELPDHRGSHVQARWLDPTHLALIVRNAKIDFQAAQCAGVTINTTLTG